MRILLVSEEITARPCEGLLVFVMHLCRFLSSRSELTALYGRGEPEESIDAYRLLEGRSLISRSLLKHFRNNHYDLLIYIPSSGATGFGMSRAAMLGRLSGCPLVMIALQSREVGKLHRIAAAISRPKLFLSSLEDLREDIEDLGIATDFIMPGVDDRLFVPAEREMAESLRRKYSIPTDRYIVLHVGHITENRGLHAFLRYRDWGDDVQPVVKAGEVDPALADRLRQAGVIVIDEYIDSIHEIYQAADLYIFPVSNRRGALEFPLSVIEAASCGLPVMTTRFGALGDVLEEGPLLRWYSSSREIPSMIRGLRKAASRPASSMASTEFSWKSVLGRFLMPHIERLSSPGGGGGR